jgi:hypothetical protein
MTLVAKELKRHAPFTAFGAFTGIVLLAVIYSIGLSETTSGDIFHTLHPAHVLLSSLVTTAMYHRYRKSIPAAVLIGLVGSLGICTISDVIFPYLGGALLGAGMELHVCFIEHPQLIFPMAFIGITIGLLRPWTRVPHAGHVLVSTWASLFYLVAFGGIGISWILYPLIFLLLFVAVWIPCCVSDIVFPLLFVRGSKRHPQPK